METLLRGTPPPACEPPRGYVHQANDTPHTQPAAPPRPDAHGGAGAPAPPPGQLSGRLGRPGGRPDVDQVLAEKNDPTMLAAERLKPTWCAGPGGGGGGAECGGGRGRRAAPGRRPPEGWDNTASVEAGGRCSSTSGSRSLDRSRFGGVEASLDGDRPTGPPPAGGSGGRGVALGQAMAVGGSAGALGLPGERSPPARLGELELPAAGCSPGRGAPDPGYRDTRMARGGSSGGMPGCSGWSSPGSHPGRTSGLRADDDPEAPTTPTSWSSSRRRYKTVIFEPAEVEAAAVRRYRPGR